MKEITVVCPFIFFFRVNLKLVHDFLEGHVTRFQSHDVKQLASAKTETTEHQGGAHF